MIFFSKTSTKQKLLNITLSLGRPFHYWDLSVEYILNAKTLERDVL